jgi:TetR/AcrR family transcriptional regulator, cholesterol catabolism regulator
LTKITEICDRVQLLFQEYGIRSITMDDIANKLGCSKKTLYVFFENRKELVLKVISNDMNKHELDINNVIAKKLHPIEEILSLNVIAINKLKTCHPSFQYDLKKYYPKSWEIFDRNNKQLTYKTCIKNLKKGIKNGCYRKDINPEIMSKMFSEKIELVFNGLLFKANDISFSEVFNEMINHYILGIVNENGREYYLNLKK